MKPKSKENPTGGVQFFKSLTIIFSKLFGKYCVFCVVHLKP